MTAYTTQTLAANVVHGTPSGNYDGGSAFISNAVPAANYYAGQGSIQTINYQLNNFIGLIKIQATLNDAQESAPWFEVANVGNIGNATTGTISTSVIGNFTWLRAEIEDFSEGTINYITILY